MTEGMGMIHKDGFLKGDVVEFQDNRHCWRRGTVQHVEWAEHRLEGPGGSVVEKRPTQIHVAVFEPFQRSVKIFILPKKRVRRVAGSA